MWDFILDVLCIMLTNMHLFTQVWPNQNAWASLTFGTK